MAKILIPKSLTNDSVDALGNLINPHWPDSIGNADKIWVDGVDDYINTGIDADPTTDWTISFSFFYQKQGAENRIIDTRNGATPNYYHGVSMGSPNHIYYHISTTTTPFTQIKIVDESLLVDGTIYEMTVVSDSANSKFIVNVTGFPTVEVPYTGLFTALLYWRFASDRGAIRFYEGYYTAANINGVTWDGTIENAAINGWEIKGSPLTVQKYYDTDRSVIGPKLGEEQIGTGRFKTYSSDGLGYVEIADRASLDLTTEGTWSFSFYGKYPFTDEADRIITKASLGDPPTERPWMIHFQQSAVKFWAYNPSDGGFNSVSFVGAISEGLNKVVITYDAGTVTMYNNGVQVAQSTSFPTTLATNNRPIRIFSDPGYVGNSTRKSVSDVRIFNRVLPPLELQVLTEGESLPLTFPITLS
jgi:hypothetical protein